MMKYSTEGYFRKVYGGSVNVISPDLVGYRESKDLVCEISSGIGLSGKVIFGMTFLKLHRLKNGDIIPLKTKNINTSVRSLTDADKLFDEYAADTGGIELDPTPEDRRMMEGDN